MADGVWEQFRLSQNSDCTALSVPLHAFGCTTSTVQFCLHSVSVISPVRTRCYFTGAVLYLSSSLGGLASRYRFYTSIKMKMVLLVSKALVAEFEAMERVQFLDEHIMKAFLSLEQY